MRWSTEDGVPPPGGGACRVFLDGEEVRHVTAFDTDEGWLEQHCLDGHTGHPGEAHVDPSNPEKTCMAPRRYGNVTLGIESWRPSER